MVLCAGGLSACGDPLVDGSYLGEPLMTLRGAVYFEGAWFDAPEDRNPPRIAVFWAGGGIGEEDQAVTTRATFPAEYTLDLLKPPPAAAQTEMPWAPGAAVAVGTPVLYDDRDGDGRWSAGDQLVGGNANIGVVHVRDDAPVGLPLTPGYQRARSDSPLCDAAGGPPLEPPAMASTTLSTQRPWNVFTDWDCDGELFEWAYLCPPEDELLDWCEFESGLLGFRLLQWCARQVCPGS